MSKALVASRLCQAMAAEAADDDLDVEIFDELTKFGVMFEDLGKIPIPRTYVTMNGNSTILESEAKRLHCHSLWHGLYLSRMIFLIQFL